MNKLIAIATAGSLLIAASAPAIAEPVVAGAPVAQAAVAQTPTVGTRGKLLRRAASTARDKRNKFLGLTSIEFLFLGLGSLFAVTYGAVSAGGGGGGGGDKPVSS